MKVNATKIRGFCLITGVGKMDHPWSSFHEKMNIFQFFYFFLKISLYFDCLKCFSENYAKIQNFIKRQTYFYENFEVSNPFADSKNQMGVFCSEKGYFKTLNKTRRILMVQIISFLDQFHPKCSKIKKNEKRRFFSKN